MTRRTARSARRGRWPVLATVLSPPGFSTGVSLIAGGMGTETVLATAELYDPKTGKFSPTGSMVAARADGKATVLLDGRVLIVAGDGNDTYAVAFAELYDPATGRFSRTGSMVTPRDSGFSATLLMDGRVLIAGGADKDVNTLASAEIFDPGTGKFTATGSMTTGRGDHTATRLSDGRVLIAGGANPPRFTWAGISGAVRPKERHLHSDRLDGGCPIRPDGHTPG